MQVKDNLSNCHAGVESQRALVPVLVSSVFHFWGGVRPALVKYIYWYGVTMEVCLLWPATVSCAYTASICKPLGCVMVICFQQQGLRYSPK